MRVKRPSDALSSEDWTLRQAERHELLQSSDFAVDASWAPNALNCIQYKVQSGHPFISCSEVHNIKGHALMIRYPGNSKARRENYTYPTSNISAKMKVISVELGREITLWIYQCVRVKFLSFYFFGLLSKGIYAFDRDGVNIKRIKGFWVTSVVPKRLQELGGGNQRDLDTTV